MTKELGCLCGHGESCKRCSPYAKNEPGECGREDCMKLAAEVRALREELDDYRVAELRGEKFVRFTHALAKLARVEALPAKWRLQFPAHRTRHLLVCSDELEAALKD